MEMLRKLHCPDLLPEGWLTGDTCDNALAVLVACHELRDSVLPIPGYFFQCTTAERLNEVCRPVLRVNEAASKDLIVMVQNRHITVNHWMLGVICLNATKVLLIDSLIGITGDAEISEIMQRLSLIMQAAFNVANCDVD